MCASIPHFFKEGNDSQDKSGYGSSRMGNKTEREKSITRCLERLLLMKKSENDFILNIAKNSIDTTRNGIGENTFVDIEINMFMNDKNICKNSLREYSKYIDIHSSKEKDPRMIPMEAMRYLLFNAGEADYYIYMEDDLVINDTGFLDKINWFYNQTDHKFILMPHRYERTVANSPKKLYVDGPIRSARYHRTDETYKEEIVASGIMMGKKVTFVEASNPHSGMLIFSNIQRDVLKENWPPSEFVSPLETAATGTALEKFPILKTSWDTRDEFQIEHGNPSFLKYINLWSQPSKSLS